MAKNEGKPFNLMDADTVESRERGETRASGRLDGRKLRRPSRGRNEQIALKTTLMKRQQMERLALRMNKSLTEILEDALDALEKSLDK